MITKSNTHNLSNNSDTFKFLRLEKVSNLITTYQFEHNLINTTAHSHQIRSISDCDSLAFLEGGLSLSVADPELLQAGHVAVVDQLQPLLLQLVRGPGGSHLAFRLRSVRDDTDISISVSALTTPKQQQQPPN